MSLNAVAVDKKKYKKDTVSYGLTLLGLLANVFYFITLYRNNDNFYYSYLMGLSVLYNLLFMLMVFLAAEEIKNYHRKFAVVLFLIGFAQFARTLVYPKLALNAQALPSDTYKMLVIYLMISGAILMLAAIISFINSTILKRYIEGKLKIPQANGV